MAQCGTHVLIVHSFVILYTTVYWKMVRNVYYDVGFVYFFNTVCKYIINQRLSVSIQRFKSVCLYNSFGNLTANTHLEFIVF